MSERLQKVLAAAGVASRRQAEEWIRAGRVTVNGRPAELGQRVDEDDTLAVDGRRLRLEKAAPAHLVLIYHRPAGEALREAEPVDGEVPKTTYDRLPPARGRRWLPLSPLAPADGGLEVFTTDGDLRAAASRLAHEIVSGYSVRVRGDVTEELLAGLAAAAQSADVPFTIESVAVGGGEGRNRWLDFETRGARGRDLRALLQSHGLEVSRLMRTRFGPIALDPTVVRARYRELPEPERDRLYDAMGLARPARRRRPGRDDEPRRGARGEGQRPQRATGGRRAGEPREPGPRAAAGKAPPRGGPRRRG
ncbi:MAG: S4 domain-containing protein [Pseudomonadota bacterium]|jgi:23S rRNA pseudouridine2605 synthase